MVLPSFHLSGLINSTFYETSVQQSSLFDSSFLKDMLLSTVRSVCLQIKQNLRVLPSQFVCVPSNFT
ncbi:LOC362727 (predicted), isoform CRA_b, partial [Rattus norvegicus]